MLEECENLKDIAWLSDFVFFIDLLNHMNKLNVKLLRRNQLIHEIWGHIRSFNEESVKTLHNKFDGRFQDFKIIERDLNVFSMPFNVDCESVKPELQLGRTD